ncbi:alpha-xylosidase [Kineothrix sp. MB12-C1]|uniref:alpha-xylosidase n=1 Tax=Kineothrix sp. MB12-C1 TaxID=3070215 RepID=UPI0027D24F34|nr:alpha-xylosidase [Kineothrix sp. MB12-C1]WMC91984.1 alpha-xylosidase [Kineothrix sp. MB12-C1]
MKFTNGYWLTRKNIKPIYAVEYAYHKIIDDKLIIYAASVHTPGRAESINVAMLTITLESPMDNIINVKVEHFRGRKDRGPHYQINDERNGKVTIWEDEEKLYYSSGSLKAIINKAKKNWKIEFVDSGKMLTETSYRNMAYMIDSDAEKAYMVEQLSLDVGEYIYGLGERFTSFVKNGQVIDMWNEDGGTASELSYKNVPFYLTNKGYGVLVDNSGDVSYEIGSEKVERVQFSVEGESLSYYVISGGTPKKSLELYTDLTGKAPLIPAWSFGLWLTTSFSTDYNENVVMKMIEGMKQRNIPLHVFHFDCFWMHAYEWCGFEWDKEIFPEPENMLQRYHEQNLKVCVWINPYISQNTEAFDECMQKGYFIHKQNGDAWQTDLWQTGMAVIDFTNPDAVEWYKNKLRTLLKMGIDCFKTDFGERIPVKDITYFDDSDPVKMHNYYSILYNKVVFEAIEEIKGRGKAVVFARTSNVGGQQYPVHWGGDCSATYPSMAETLRGGLSLASCGFAFWSHDISGFEQTATPDIYKRWCAFGLLSSHSRLHGGVSYRVPWLFDEESSDVLAHFVKLKCTLMPYIYRQAVLAHEIGVPMLRPMFMEFFGDRVCETLDRQYMFGDSLLIAPIFNDAGEVEYYLPEGKWVHLLSGEIVQGGSYRKEVYNYFSLPLWVRENSILPIGKNSEEVEYDYAEGVTLYISEMTLGASSSAQIVDTSGEVIMSVSAVCEKSRIVVEVDSFYDDYKVIKIGHPATRIYKEENVTIIEI